MRLRRVLQVVVVSGTLVSPLAAFAASVTTSPLGLAAPALRLVVLIALAIVLVGAGLYSLRRRSAAALAGFALVAGLSVLAGLGYANPPGVVIDDGDCHRQSVHVYSDGGSTLTSLCPGPIKIDALDCDGVPPLCVALVDCTVGQILANGESCNLPACRKP